MAEQENFANRLWDRIRKRKFKSVKRKQVSGIEVEETVLSPDKRAGFTVDHKSLIKRR